MRPRIPTALVASALAAVTLLAAAPPAFAQVQERILFTAVDDAKTAILERIRNETVRIDVAVWLLTEHEISINLVNKHKAGVLVRVLGDRASIFEADPNTRREFEYLASNGVPIRLRYHPTWFPEAMHWKCGIFVGQGIVEFGSANWTTFELSPWSSTNFHDETAMFTDDLALVAAFKTKFDQMWADTTYFLDWPEAYRRETGQDWTTPMTIDRRRLEPDNPTPPGMIWGQGSELNNAMVTEIDRETIGIDMVIYRLSVSSVTDALIRRIRAGVPVRIIVEPLEYRRIHWPEYWLTGARIDQLWVAGARIKERAHQGLTHMKTLITSGVALNASSNFTRNWQRDHNYFISPATKPLLFNAMKDRFQAMWSDTTNFRDFYPRPPSAPSLVGPADGQLDVSTTPRLEWTRAPWAVAFDVYLGTSASNMTRVGRVDAQLTEDPPATYSWTPPQALQPGTTYYWRIVSRTFATDVDPSLVAGSDIRSFRTVQASGGGPTPFTGTPAALPGTVEAENFDHGGQGVAYYDHTAGNAGGAYRATDVDIAAAADTSGGYTLGWVGAGEWLAYTVNVAAAGTYDVEFRVASSGPGGTFHVEIGGVDRTGPIAVPDTGGWQTWRTIRKTGVSLAAGVQVWRLVMDTAGPSAAVGNFNYFRVVAPGGGGGGPTPFTGTPAALPGTVEAENFDHGGEGVAYHDISSVNRGGQYRAEGVDIEATSDTGGGYNVGWIGVGEWLLYTVNVTTAGTYTLEFRVACGGQGGTFHLEVNGVDVTGPITIPDTGSWQSWTTVRRTGVSLAAGQQRWRIVVDSAGSAGVGNLNYFRVVSP
jgi:hypothetical protein